MKKVLGTLVVLMAVIFAASLVLPTLAEAKASLSFSAKSTSDGMSVKGGGGSRSSSGSRGGSFGGSRSSSGSKSSGGSGWGKSSSSSSKKATAPSSAPQKSNSAWGSSKASKSTAKMSATDKAAYSKAKQNGTAFTNRDAAAADFRTKHGAAYSSKFATEPTTRPSYVPQAYSSGGNTYNISYNRQHGGYGYMDALGMFIIYDALSDNNQADHLMRQQGYYYGDVPGDDGIGVLGVVLIIGLALGTGAIIYKFATA